MAITFRGAGAAAAALNASVNPALFESPTSGDLLLCYASGRNDYGLGTITAPAGWSTQFAFENTSGGQISLYYKIATGGDANPTVGITGTPDAVLGQCCAFRGVNTTTPFGASGANYTANNLQNIGPILGLTPLVSDAVVVVFGEKADAWTSVNLLTGDGLTWVEIAEPNTLIGSTLVNSGSQLLVEYRITTVSAAQTATCHGASGLSYAAALATYFASDSFDVMLPMGMLGTGRV